MQQPDAETAIVVFDVAGHPYALAAAHVREVVAWRAPRPLPGSNASIDGVINLRGGVIPVCDLAQSLGVGALGPVSTDTAIVVYEVDGGSIGLMVDSVRAVVTITPEDRVACDATHPAVEAIVRDGGAAEHHELVVLLRPVAELAGGLPALDGLFDSVAVSESPDSGEHEERKAA